jgi:hypothetical protein
VIAYVVLLAIIWIQGDLPGIEWEQSITTCSKDWGRILGPSNLWLTLGVWYGSAALLNHSMMRLKSSKPVNNWGKNEHGGIRCVYIALSDKNRGSVITFADSGNGKYSSQYK